MINSPAPGGGNQVLVFGAAMMGAAQFAQDLIAHVRTGGALDDATLQSLRNKSVVGIKDCSTGGMSMQAEANTVAQAATMLERLLDAAITQGKAGKKS